jgi:hypothetical protein
MRAELRKFPGDIAGVCHFASVRARRIASPAIQESPDLRALLEHSVQPFVFSVCDP